MRRRGLRRMRRRQAGDAFVKEAEASAEEQERHRRNVKVLEGMIAYAESRGYEHANEDAMLAYARGRLEALGGGKFGISKVL